MANKKLKIKVLKPLWGKFNLPYVVGRTYSVEEKLANELILAGCAITESDAKKADKVNESEDTTEPAKEEK